MPEPMLTPPGHNHNHQHHNHGAMGAPVSQEQYPTTPMVQTSLNGQPVLMPLAQWQAQQGMGAAAPTGAGILSGGMGRILLAVGLGVGAWWLYKKYYKDKHTEYFGGEARHGKRRRSNSKMMEEFQSFLEARESMRSEEGAEEDEED